MADIKTQIKRRNGASWDTLRPETEVAQIVDIDTITVDNLEDLDNVIVSSPSNGQVLKYNGSNWVNAADSNTADTNTTYTISAVDSGNDAIIRLTAGGSGSGTDDVKLVAGSNITLTPSGDNITISATDTNTVYTHPTHPGDDIDIDTGALTGATVISDLDFNITSDTLGHITDANATISTRNLTAADIGAAPLASPALTGTPTAPTASSATNNTQIATTAFVTNKLAGVSGGMNFAGSISLSTAKNGDNLAAAGLTGPGDYLIVTATGDITNAGATLVTLAVQAPGDEGDSTLPVTLETGDWIVYVSGDGSTMTVAIINNTDTRFAPTTHTHTIANVTGLQTALDGKLSTSGKAADSELLDGIDSSAFLRSNATDTASGQITFTGDMFAKNVDFVGGTNYNENIRMHPGTNDYSSLILGAVSGTSGTGVGQWTIVRYPATTTNNKFAIRHNSTDALTIDTSGVLYSGTSSTIFHDGYHPNADTLTTARNIALTGAVTGNANFDGSGNISIATTHTADPVITLTGAVTGSGTMTNLGNVSIATTATADPTLTINGDASGSATFTNLGNATLTLTVNDDSHNHIISNVDGLQAALDGKHSNGYPVFSGDAINKASLATRTESGFYEHDTAATADGWPVNGGWYHAMASTHSNDGNYFSMQFAADFFDSNNLFYRSVNNSGTTSWNRVWHSGNLTNLNQLTNGPGYVTSSGVTSVATGGGLTGGTITGTGTISHADTSSQASVNNSGRTYIQDITLDTYGHIIGISSATETVTNTDTNYYLTGVSGSGNGTVTFTRQSLGNLTWNASHTHDDRYYTESESLSLFLRRDVYNSANSGLQVFRNLGTATGSWGDNDHTFGLENSDAGYLTMNFHRAGYTSNNLLYTGTYFNFDLELRVNNSTVWNTGNLTNLNQLSNGPGYVTSSGVTSVATGGGLTGGTITSTGTISHADTSSQGSVNNSGNTFIQDITLDTYGHITAITSATANNVGNADTVDGYHAVAFVRNVYSEFLDSSFPAAPLTTSFTSWSKPAGMPSVTLEANSRYYVFAAGSYYTAATTTGIGISPTFSTVSGQIRGGQIWINTSTSTTAGTSEFTANWRTMSTSGGQTGNFALGTAGPTSNPGNEFGFYGIVETSGNSTVLSMHIRSEVNGSAVNVNRLALTAMKLPI